MTTTKTNNLEKFRRDQQSTTQDSLRSLFNTGVSENEIPSDESQQDRDMQFNTFARSSRSRGRGREDREQSWNNTVYTEHFVNYS